VKDFNDPLKEPTGVRDAETMTASWAWRSLAISIRSKQNGYEPWSERKGGETDDKIHEKWKPSATTAWIYRGS